MSAACLQLTEATLGFPNCYDDAKTEVTLWGPETIHAMPGAAAWMRDDDAHHKIFELVVQSGMHWDNGPWLDAVISHTFEMEEWEEHGTAYEKWCNEDATMNDLHEPSYYLEWNPAEGASTWVGGGELHKNRAKVPQFTPEMLLQREILNWNFNHEWNLAWEPASRDGQVSPSRIHMNTPDQTLTMEIVAVGDNHGVAKCMYGAVYIPKGALKYLLDTGYLFGGGIGSQFKGHITFAPSQKFPWRLKKDGIIHSISECLNYYNDY